MLKLPDNEFNHTKRQAIPLTQPSASCFTVSLIWPPLAKAPLELRGWTCAELWFSPGPYSTSQDCETAHQSALSLLPMLSFSKGGCYHSVCTLPGLRGSHGVVLQRERERERNKRWDQIVHTWKLEAPCDVEEIGNGRGSGQTGQHGPS